jgi:hypothetical protein
MTPKLPPDIEAAIDEAEEYDLSQEALERLVDAIADEVEAEISRGGLSPDPCSDTGSQAPDEARRRR